MMRVLLIFALMGTMACQSKPRRNKNEDLTCMEKTTRKVCTVQKNGQKACSCVPDDSEMYGTYPKN